MGKKKFILNINISIEAMDDVEARKRASRIVGYFDDYMDIEKANLKEIIEGKEPRIVNFKPD